MKRLIVLSLLITAATLPLSADTIYCLTASNELVTIDSAKPSTLISRRPITGLAEGDRIITIDFRPSNGLLYGISNSNFLYRIDHNSAAATAIDVLPFQPALSGPDLASDFDPVIDRLRVVDQADRNLRIHPDLGRTVSNDTTVAWATGDPGAGTNPSVVGLANSSNVPGASDSVTYVIDSTRDILATLGKPGDGVEAPSGGQLFTVGPLGIDTTSVVGFDISDKGLGWALLSIGSSEQLYSVDLATGIAAPRGTFGVSNAIDLAARFDERVYVLQVAGRVEGANNTLFRTDVRIVNRSSTQLSVRLDFYPTGENGNSAPTASKTIEVAPGTETVINDIMKTQFNLDLGVGAVVVRSIRPIVIASRIYNDQRAVGAGTFGQFAAALESGQSKSSGTLPFLANNPALSGSGFRGNIGWFNLSGSSAEVTFTAFSTSGAQLATRTLTVRGQAHQQASLSQLFPNLAEINDLYVTFQAGSGTLFVYGSVVDNVNGDAIFVPAF